MNVTILRLSCATSVSLVVIEEKSFRPPVVGTPAYLATRGGGTTRGMCRCEGYGFQAVYSRIGYINQNVWV